MKKLLLLLCLSVTGFTISSCKRNVVEGRGEIITESRTVSTFNAIVVEAPIDVDIQIEANSTPSISLKGYGNILSKIKCEVVNGELRINKEGIFTYYTDKDIVAVITLPSLNALSIKGAADAIIKGDLRGDAFKLDVKGAGDVDIERLNTNSFESSVSGAGDLTVKTGLVNSASFTVTGAGDIDAFGLQIKKAKARLSGAGDMNITATETLDAKISGAGNISYKGNPSLTSHISGIGSLDNAN